MKDVLTTFAGFLLGIIGSYIFWRYLLVLKPNIKISPITLKGFDYINTQKLVYRIKLINFGNRQIIGLNASARIVERRNNRWTTIDELKMEYDGELAALGRHKDYGDYLSRIGPIYYMRILDEKKFESNLNEDKRLVFTLSAKDALSGTTVVQRQVYNKDDIQQGDFKEGFTFEKKSKVDDGQ